MDIFKIAYAVLSGILSNSDRQMYAALAATHSVRAPIPVCRERLYIQLHYLQARDKNPQVR